MNLLQVKVLSSFPNILFHANQIIGQLKESDFAEFILWICSLNSCHSKYDPGTNSIDITCVFITNADSQVPHQTY